MNIHNYRNYLDLWLISDSTKVIYPISLPFCAGQLMVFDLCSCQQIQVCIMQGFDPEPRPMTTHPDLVPEDGDSNFAEIVRRGAIGQDLIQENQGASKPWMELDFLWFIWIYTVAFSLPGFLEHLWWSTWKTTPYRNCGAKVSSPKKMSSQEFMKQRMVGWWFQRFFIFHFIYGMSSFPLTNIFEDDWSTIQTVRWQGKSFRNKVPLSIDLIWSDHGLHVCCVNWAWSELMAHKVCWNQLPSGYLT